MISISATLSAASYAATTVSAATVVGKAMLSGQMGTYSQWNEEDAIANGSTVANIDGNAQYEATWNITGDGTGSTPRANSAGRGAEIITM